MSDGKKWIVFKITGHTGTALQMSQEFCLQYYLGSVFAQNKEQILVNNHRKETSYRSMKADYVNIVKCNLLLTCNCMCIQSAAKSKNM